MPVLITGANRGIGLGFVRAYADTGSSVLATCRNPSKAETLRSLANQFPNISIYSLDLASDESIFQLVSNLEGNGEYIDILISNAGVLENEVFGNWTRRRFADTFDTNVFGPAILVQALTTLLTENAKIIQLSSGLGSLEWGGEGMSDGASYSMSKAALNMLTVRLARSSGSRNRLAVSISPGWVATDMGGSGADLSVEESVSKMMVAIQSLTPADSGRFIDNRGNTIPW